MSLCTPFHYWPRLSLGFTYPCAICRDCVSWLNAPKLEKTDLYFSGQKYITVIREVVSSIALSHLIKLIPCQVDLSCPVPQSYDQFPLVSAVFSLNCKLKNLVLFEGLYFVEVKREIENNASSENTILVNCFPVF